MPAAAGATPGRAGCPGGPRRRPSSPWEGDPTTRGRADRGLTAPFLVGEIADRGPLERGTPTPPEPRARDAREFQRQAAWRASAVRVIEEVRQPLDADDAALDESLDEPGVAPGRGSVARAAAATLEPSAAPPRRGAMAAVPARAPEAWPPSESDLAAWAAAAR